MKVFNFKKFGIVLDNSMLLEYDHELSDDELINKIIERIKYKTGVDIYFKNYEVKDYN